MTFMFDIVMTARGETGEQIRVDTPNLLSAHVELFKLLAAARLEPGETATLSLTAVAFTD